MTFWKLRRPNPITFNFQEKNPTSVESALPLVQAELNLPVAAMQTATPDKLSAPSKLNEPITAALALTSGLERYPVNPELEKYISHLNTNAETKKLLLSGTLVHSVMKTGNPRDFMPAEEAFEKELDTHKADFLTGIKALVGQERDFPPDLGDGLMSIASNIGASNSPEIQSIATSHIQIIKNNEDLNSEEARGALSQSIAAYIYASPDQSAAWSKIKESLDLNDPNQDQALKGAKLFVQVNDK